MNNKITNDVLPIEFNGKIVYVKVIGEEQTYYNVNTIFMLENIEMKMDSKKFSSLIRINQNTPTVLINQNNQKQLLKG